MVWGPDPVCSPGAGRDQGLRTLAASWGAECSRPGARRALSGARTGWEACVSRAQPSTRLHGGRSCWNPRKSPFLNVPPAPSTQRLSISAGRNTSGVLLVIAEKALKAVEREVGHWHTGPLWGRLSLSLSSGPLGVRPVSSLARGPPSGLLQDRDQGPRVQRNLPELLYFFSLFPFPSIIKILYFLDCLSTFVIFSSFLWIFLL